MRKFSVRPTATLRGRTFKGLRGWSGKPAHPPLTDIPVAAYIFAAAFDLIATFGRNESWAQGFYRAATYVVIGGAAVSVFTALTGFWDWLRSTEKGTQARRTANAHAWAMLIVTVLVLVNIALRVSEYDRTYPTPAILALSIVVAVLVTAGAALGGTLVFDYGFNVETADDSPVWHRSEKDVLPGEHSE